MAPGIRRVDGVFGENALTVVVDEKHGKFLAVGRSIFNSEKLSATKKGKTITNLHYVGDPIWEIIKTLASR